MAFNGLADKKHRGKQEVGKDNVTLRNQLPLARSLFLQLPEPPKTAPQTKN